MTLRRKLIWTVVVAAAWSAGCRQCGERRLCGNARPCDLPTGRLLANPGPTYSDAGYSAAPYSGGMPIGVPVSAPGFAQPGPPNELPFPGGDNINPPGVPLAQGRPELPAPQPLGPPASSPVGLPR